MKILLYALLLCGLTHTSVQASPVDAEDQPRVSLSNDISGSLVSAMAEHGLLPVATGTLAETWSFASLSCIAADFADGGSGEPFRAKECTFEDSAGVEFKISAELSASLIDELKIKAVQPMGGSSDELQFFSVKNFVCDVLLVDASEANQCESVATTQCHFENRPALFGAN